MMLSLLAIVAAASFASAADELSWVYPSARGPTGNGSTTAPCGGYDPSAPRTDYPLTGTNIIFNSSTLLANINVMHINQTNPTRFHGFATYTQSVLTMSTGQYCSPGPDFTQFSGYSVGNDATLLIIYQNYNGNASSYEYTCADVRLVEASSYSQPSDLVCSNSSALINLAPLEQSLKLSGSNFSDSRMGEDGQQIVIANTPLETVASATVATITDATTARGTDAHGRTQTSGTAAATSAASVTGSGAQSSGTAAAGASASASGGAGRSVEAVGGSLLAVAGLLAVVCM